VLSYYATNVCNKYLAKFTDRGLSRRIDSVTFRLKLLSKLDSSTKALLIFSFQIIFMIVLMASMGFIIHHIQLVVGEPLPGANFFELVIIIMIVVLLIYAGNVLHELDRSKEAMDKLKLELTMLQNRKESKD
jgi:hypothetical protein